MYKYCINNLLIGRRKKYDVLPGNKKIPLIQDADVKFYKSCMESRVLNVERRRKIKLFLKVGEGLQTLHETVEKLTNEAHELEILKNQLRDDLVMAGVKLDELKEDPIVIGKYYFICNINNLLLLLLLLNIIIMILYIF